MIRIHEVLASALPEQSVLSADGRELGTARGLTVEPRTGELAFFVVETDCPGADAFETTEDGLLRIPATLVCGFDDHLPVSLPD